MLAHPWHSPNRFVIVFVLKYPFWMYLTGRNEINCAASLNICFVQAVSSVFRIFLFYFLPNEALLFPLHAHVVFFNIYSPKVRWAVMN